MLNNTVTIGLFICSRFNTINISDMKKIFSVLAFVALAFTVFSQSTLPSKHDLAGGNYTFTSWASSATAGTYPSNMVFHYVSSEQSTAFTTDGNLNFNCSYDLTVRPRINGQGANGFSFVNTGSSQFNDCSSGTAGSRFIGAAVVGLDATGRKDLKVTWTGRTINGQAAAREYKVALQYKIGAGSWNNLSTPNEYLYDSIIAGGTSNLTGASQTFTDVALPAACDNESSVYVRWIYYNVTGSGNRPILGVDDITISSVATGGGPTTVNLSVSPATVSETGEPTVTITATASAPVVGTQTVDYTISGTGITAGDFVSGGLSGTITILNGNTTGTATRQINDDAVWEGNETATVTISNPSAGFILGSTTTANFTIEDNDQVQEVLLPQYIQGTSTTNANRVPFFCRLTLNGLTPSRTYRYYTSIVNSGDGATSNGAGNPILVDAGGFVSNNPSLSSAGGYAEFTTNGSGSYTGWFGLQPTGNARFVPGANLFLRIMLNDGSGGTSVASRLTTSSSFQVLNLHNTGTGDGLPIRSTSCGDAKNFVAIWDNTAGTGRPISVAVIESDDLANSTNYAAFYKDDVDAKAKAWGTIIPENLPNGIRRIEQFSLSTGSAVGVAATDADGTWPTGSVNTVNQTGGTTALVIANADAPLVSGGCAPIVNVSVLPTSGTEDAQTTITITATAASAVSGNQTVDFAITGTGITSSDFVGAPSLTGTITILDGQTTGSVTRQIFDDALIEGTETATVTISNPSSGITISTSTASFTIIDNDATVIYSRGSGNSFTDAIWAFTPTGTPSTIAALNGTDFRFTKDFDLVIQSGDVVNWTQTDSVKNLTVESGAKLRRNNNNDNSSLMTYLRVFGTSVTVNGEMGEVLSSPNFDAIGLDIAAASCEIAGTGTYNIARLRNNNCSGNCEAVIKHNVNFRFPGTCIYTEQNFSNFHVQINSGVTVNVIGVDGNGDVATDGVNGISSNPRGGTFTVNGTLNIADTLFARGTNNDGLYECGMTINNSGKVNAAHVLYQEIDTSLTNFTFSLNGNGKLNISKVLNLVSGVFSGSTGVVLESTSMDDCAIIDNFSPGHAGEIDGFITMQRFYSNTVKTNNQHIISSPVDKPAYSQFATLTGVNNVFVTPTADCSDTATAPGSNYGNIFEYDESNVSAGQCYVKGWKVRSAGNATNGKGFSVRRPGTGIISVQGNPNSEPSYTITGLTNSNWSSTSKQGRTYISGYHLIGNPYPASLDLVNPNPTEFANIVKVLDPATGQFIDVSMSGSDVIAPFQGFAVLKANVGGTADFTINGGINRKRTAATFYKNHDELKQFEVSVQGANGTDKTYINIINDATTGFDMAYDAYKMYGDIKLPALYTVSGNNIYSTNTFGGVSQTPVVPLNFEPNANGNFTLTFDGAENLPNISKVWFEDAKTGFGMDVTNGGTYAFNAAKNDSRARFTLRFVAAKIISGIDAADEKALKIFASGRTLNVDLGTGNTKGSAAVYNAMGALVYELPLFESFTQTELENIATGTYFVKVSSPNGSLSKKIIITE